MEQKILLKQIIKDNITYDISKPITRKIMDYKIRHDKFDNMNDGYGAIEDWNTSKITDMSWLFRNKWEFNRDISKWDVSKVVDMKYMFSQCFEFNQNLNDWDVSNVKHMNHMFHNCYNFNNPLYKWKVSNVERMDYMFYRCDEFCRKLCSGQDGAQGWCSCYLLLCWFKQLAICCFG